MGRPVLQVLNASYDAQFSVSEVKLRAEMRLGVLLAMMENAWRNQSGRSQDATTLESLGINKTQSSRWQQEAMVDADKLSLSGSWGAAGGDGEQQECRCANAVTRCYHVRLSRHQ